MAAGRYDEHGDWPGQRARDASANGRGLRGHRYWNASGAEFAEGSAQFFR